MMTRLAIWISLLAFCAAGCGPKLSPEQIKIRSLAPRAQYLAALQAELKGDFKLYQDTLLHLADDHGDTRAGRRARATLTAGGGLETVWLMGVVAAIAVPQFQKFQSKASQSEVQTMLKMFPDLVEYASQSLESSDEDAETSSEAFLRALELAIGEVKVSNSMSYVFFIKPREPLFGARTGLYDRVIDRLIAENLEPYAAGPKRWRAVAVGNIDDDETLDIWFIGPSGRPMNLVDDVTE